MSSDERPSPLNTAPVLDSGEHHLHTHPLPRAVRVLLVVYGLVLGLTLSAIVVLIYNSSVQNEHNRQADRDRIDRELAERSAARDKKEAARDAETRRRVCAVLANDLVSSVNNTQLQLILGCVVVAKTPVPGSTVAPAPNGGTVRVVPVPGPSGPMGPSGPAGPPGTGSPAPAPQSSATTRPSPRPSPSPSPPPCGPVNQLTGRC